MNPLNSTFGDYEISDDKRRLDIGVIHDFLAQSYWSPGIPRSVVERAVEGSICFGVYHQQKQQVGFARVITDAATFAYLADVFVLEAHCRKGVAKELMRFISADPRLQGLRRFMLATRDAHALYRQFGFTALSSPDRLMEKLNADVYRSL